MTAFVFEANAAKSARDGISNMGCTLSHMPERIAHLCTTCKSDITGGPRNRFRIASNLHPATLADHLPRGVRCEFKARHRARRTSSTESSNNLGAATPL